ncbi:hypothetical protein QIS74_09547 [Colletotrichum tabaci]|uniref:Uncharacterized protein n=1 Tax=Colletotrichum tabaci TaxID=1209068 RepID=A0AAV9T7H6_9PEZI
MSNCGVIHEGHGVVGTAIEMPASCGPGKYAMAVSLEPSRNQSVPRRLEKRADELADSPIFDLAKYELVRHTVNEQFRWNICDESVSCNIKGVDTTGYFTAWADLNVNIQSSALVTLIGNLQDLNSFEESHVLFRDTCRLKQMG